MSPRGTEKNQEPDKFEPVRGITGKIAVCVAQCELRKRHLRQFAFTIPFAYIIIIDMKLEKVIVASSNAGKVKEIKEIFSGTEIVSLKDLGFNEEIPETGESFKENAYIKASTICAKYGLPALADDSGLCVYSLDGAPGIYSARFSGEGPAANRALLLKRMRDLTDREAYFECNVCLCFPDGKALYGSGRTYGRILYEEIGTNGFGYDPLFWSMDLKKSFGVATDEEKNSVSHRARALQDLADKLARL